ncbi:MAG TPA: HNH endonuclease [Rhodothermales bacterium]|nr:HNH endonuclease [Gemmatimonadaceae bacterium]
MHLLYHWRSDNYRRDRRFGFGFHLNQNSPAMKEAGPGESVWAFTRRRDGLYALAAELVVRAVTLNSPNYRYGRFRVWGDLGRSRYFDVDAPRNNAEPLIRRALSVRAEADVLGRSFQGHAAVRPLTAEDHRVLSAFARDLPHTRAAGIFAEDEFEARLLFGERARTRLIEESGERRDVRMQYLYETVDVTRARRNVETLHELYDGRCQICEFDPYARYAVRLCNGHHIEWLSRGGDDVLDNMALLCPNHHAAVHKDDAVFDYATLTFAFSNGRREGIRLNRHLERAA